MFIIKCLKCGWEQRWGEEVLGKVTVIELLSPESITAAFEAFVGHWRSFIVDLCHKCMPKYF